MNRDEPYHLWLERKRQQRLHEQAELRMRRPRLPQLAEEILDIVSGNSEGEMTRFEIVNQLSKQVGARSRVARKECRLKAFGCITGLLRLKLLEWGRRNYVRLAPWQKHVEYIESQRAMLRNLPPPILN